MRKFTGHLERFRRDSGQNPCEIFFFLILTFLTRDMHKKLGTACHSDPVKNLEKKFSRGSGALLTGLRSNSVCEAERNLK